MAYHAILRGVKISARKVRPLATLIRGKSTDEAIRLLRYQPQRGARMLEKVLKSAMANAEDRRSQDLSELVVTDARIDGAGLFKRIRPRARGMAFGILRRLSHIRVEVGTVDELPRLKRIG